MVNRKFIFAVTAFMALTACEKDDWDRDFSDNERSVLDNVVGIYKLTDAYWPGGVMDLDRDGTSGSLFDEIGVIDRTNCEIRVDKNNGSESDGYMYVVIPVCEIHDIYVSLTCMPFNVYFNVTGGQFSLLENNLQDMGPDFSNVTVDWSGEDILTVSGDTRFHDYAAGMTISGRVSYTFTCISGKGKQD